MALHAYPFPLGARIFITVFLVIGTIFFSFAARSRFGLKLVLLWIVCIAFVIFVWLAV